MSKQAICIVGGVYAPSMLEARKAERVYFAPSPGMHKALLSLRSGAYKYMGGGIWRYAPYI